MSHLLAWVDNSIIATYDTSRKCHQKVPILPILPLTLLTVRPLAQTLTCGSVQCTLACWEPPSVSQPASEGVSF
eukprot:2970269-Prymnesium_polylepis.1